MGDLEHVIGRLEDTSKRLQGMSLSASKVESGILRGGRTASDGFLVDRYITYKSSFGDAVALAVLHGPGDDVPYLELRRRRTEGRSMSVVSVDHIPMASLDVACELFINLAWLASSVPNSSRDE